MDDHARRLLQRFVNLVRGNRPVSKRLLEFMADGGERLLENKKPWPARRGPKKKTQSQAWDDAFAIYFRYLKLKEESAPQATRAYIITIIAEDIQVSEDTVKRRIAVAKAAIATNDGRERWCLYRREHENRTLICNSRNSI